MTKKTLTTTAQKKAWVKRNWGSVSIRKMANSLKISDNTISKWAEELGLKSQLTKPVTVEEKLHKEKEKKEAAELKKLYKTSLEKSDQLKKELDSSLALKQNISPVVFEYKELTNDTESVAVVLASDWHLEERVKPETVDGLNNFTLGIAQQRVEQFAQMTLKLVHLERLGTKIDTLVLALLGDFFTGNIHEENLETAQLQPIEAAIFAENQIISVIQYLLDNSDINLIIPTHAGNHSRITRRIHISTEGGNSLETMMYHHIKNHFKGNERVKILISEGYLSYLDVWGYTICFSHGHAIKYAGGIGGLGVPLKRGIAQWQKSRRANLYCIGHHHQYLDINEAIVNGSLIGYNAFARFIKAEFERPKQAFFVINKKHKEKVCARTILFSV